jgi:hypothetical protein
VVRAHLYERPRPLRELAPWVPTGLADACQAALAKDPARRPSSAAALATRLRAASSRPAAPVAGSAGARTTRLRPARRRDPVRRQRPAEPTRVIAAAPAGSSTATTVKVGAGRAAWRRHRRRTALLLVGALVVVLAALAVMELRGSKQAVPARRSFTGRRVVDLHLGNAGGVQLTVNGTPRGAPGRPGQVWRGRFATPGGP